MILLSSFFMIILGITIPLDNDYTDIRENDYENNEKFEEHLLLSGDENLNTSDKLSIQVVKSYPFLYQKQHKDYKGLIMKENAWTEIGLALNSPALECSNRWSRLRQYYTRERLKRHKETRIGSGLSKRKKWILYNYLTFLNEHVSKRKTFGNFTPLVKTQQNKKIDVTKISQNCNANIEEQEFLNIEDINKETNTDLYSQACIYEAGKSCDAVMNHAATTCQTSIMLCSSCICVDSIHPFT